MMHPLPKSLFKQNEVCGLTGVKPYVLRFWEREFDEISPVSSENGEKLYEQKDIETIAFVKRLLFGEKMSIDEARERLREGDVPRETHGPPDPGRTDIPAPPVHPSGVELGPPEIESLARRQKGAHRTSGDDRLPQGPPQLGLTPR